MSGNARAVCHSNQIAFALCRVIRPFGKPCLRIRRRIAERPVGTVERQPGAHDREGPCHVLPAPEALDRAVCRRCTCGHVEASGEDCSCGLRDRGGRAGGERTDPTDDSTPHPACDGTEFEERPLSRRGRIWSCTNASYQPPEPFVAPEPFVPFTIAAVELEAERMVVLGQVVAGVDVTDLKVGQEMELVLDTLYTDAESEKLIWKWKPVA